MTCPRFRSLVLFATVCLAVATVVARSISVDGLGLLEDLRVAGFLEELAEPGDMFEATIVEEGFFLLQNRLRDEGYLDPSLRAEIKLRDGTRRELAWEGGGGRPLDDDVELRSVRFVVEKGIQAYYDELTFEGLTVIERETATGFFWADPFLFSFEQDRIFSPNRFRQGMGSLQAELRAHGYREAMVSEAGHEIDRETGSVRARVQVKEGIRSVVIGVEEALGSEVDHPFVQKHLESREVAGEPLNDEFLQSAATDLRTRFFRLGFPDAQTNTEVVAVTAEEAVGSDRRVRVRAVLRPGPRERIAAVEFRGNEDTHKAFLERKADLEPGEWLDRTEVEDARSRLARLGVFRDLRTAFEDADGAGRAVVFELEEGIRQEASLLLGWGSYEQLRGGVSYQHHNLWGRAHQFQAQALLSLKSAETAVRYRIPEFYNFPATAQGSARLLQRDEVSFTREEGFLEAGLDWRRRSWNSLFGLSYRMELLRARDVVSEEIEVPDQTRAGSVFLRHRYDDRDALINPEDGFVTETEIELSAPPLGSEVTYQRLDTRWVWHRKLSDTVGLHLALRHRVLASWGEEAKNLPLNKRFFPGGEDSIRGYTEGGAAPRDASGVEIGAEVTTVANVEVEVALTRRLSFVVFSDSLLQARSIDQYPGDTDLYSVGAGLRYHTPLGPLRLEYGYNLNPRPGDGTGALHLSLGYPF